MENHARVTGWQKLFAETSKNPRTFKRCKAGKFIGLSSFLIIGLCATSLSLRHFDVICDQLLKRRMAAWNLIW